MKKSDKQSSILVSLLMDEIKEHYPNLHQILGGFYIRQILKDFKISNKNRVQYVRYNDFNFQSVKPEMIEQRAPDSEYVTVGKSPHRVAQE